MAWIRHPSLFAAIAALALISAGPLAGQQPPSSLPGPTQPPGVPPIIPPPPTDDSAQIQLAAARSIFLRQILADSQVLTDQYERALAKLEGELAAAAEYEEALLVQKRRAELKSLYANGDLPSGTSLGISLLPSQAKLSGVEARGNELTGWRSANSGAEWSSLRVPPGRYYLELEANVVELPPPPPPPGAPPPPPRTPPPNRATFEFLEVSLLPGAAENRRSFEVAATRDDTAFSKIRVGPVTFVRSPITLRLLTTAGNAGSLVRLRNPRLVPAVEEVPAVVTAPSLAPTTALADLRGSLNSSLAAVQRTLIERSLAQLERIAAGSPEVRDAAEAEKKRLRRLMQRVETEPLGLLTASSPAAGFEDLEGARFVPDPANRGDRFMVEHEGRRLSVRLLWVLCAPVDEQDQAAAKAFAKHFDMEPEHVPGLGRAAREFTAGYLTGKPLRLLVRPARDKDGTSAALVFVPGLGLYQNALIDQGLAAVQPPSQEARRGMMENTLLGNLVDRERVARRQKPPPGAWAFYGEADK